ncbi:MAG: hypothetical protein LLF76_11090 [Planctomycetaceae bacterium]|nr:hypothetical protein [Planctomycetaceae bacterium]
MLHPQENQKLNRFQEFKIVWKWFIAGVRWLSIIFFGCLFFLGLYLKLPGKALACLAVIPVVGLFVPRKIQPWIWMTLTVLLISLFAWLYLPEVNSSDWKPYEFQQHLGQLERQFPAAGPNAADLYQQVLDEYGETIFYFRFEDQEEEQTLLEPWDPAEHPRLDFWITALQPAMQKLIEAAAIDQCRFDIPHNLLAEKPQLGRLNQLRGWSRLMMRAASRDLYNGLHEDALMKELAVAGVARHLYQQKTLMDQSTAFQVELLAARALESFIINYSSDPNQLDRIEQTFAAVDPHWARNWPDILAREKLQSKNLMGLFYEVSSGGSIRFSHSAMMALQEGLGYRPKRLFINQQFMNRVAVIGLWLCLPSNPEDLAALIDDRFDHYSLQVQHGSKFQRFSLRYIWVLGLNVQSIVDWLAMQRVGYYWALDGQFQRHQAIEHTLTAFSAMKRFHTREGRWPDRLDELGLDAFALLDPLSNKPFVYRVTESGFQFYSLGANGTDDGGQNDSNAGKDDILIWPRKDALPEENDQ